MDQTKWIRELAEDESLWALEEMIRCAWPAPIVWDYIRLRKQMEKGNVYGAIFKFRDLYEMTLKIPTLMALIYMDHKDEETLTCNQNMMKILTGNPMSMGAWYELSVEIKKTAGDFSIPADLTDVIRATQDVYRLKVGDNADIVDWRNDTIGHGALKFEDHDDYKKEIQELMIHYREYVFRLEKEKSSYRECFFVLNDIPLTGDVDMGTLPDGTPALTIAGETFMLGKFSSGKRFLLDSFFSRKKMVRYADCYSGDTMNASDKPFLNYLQMRFRLNEDVTKRYLSTEEDFLLKKMHEPEKYKKPVGLLERVNSFLDKPGGKGLLLLSMERGTGKTAFCYSMDGLMNRSLIKNAVVRCYSFATAQMRGVGDFTSAMNEDFRRKNYPSVDFIRSVGEELPRIQPDEKEPAAAMAHLLNAYQKMYRETEGIDRLVLVVDGLDEITRQTERIADFIPDGEQLNEGVFVICTSRFPDEPDVSGYVAGRITVVREKADSFIDVRREDPVNQTVLKTYADGWMQSNHRKRLGDKQKEELIKKADYRLLRLKILLPLQDVVPDMGSTETDVFRCYLDYMQSCSDEKSFQKMLHFLVSIAMYGQLSLEEYCGLIGADDLSYAFIGRLNDMMPVLTARSTRDGRIYELSNWQYRLYLPEQYPEKIESVIREFQTAFSVWAEDYCNDDFSGEVEEQFRICDFWIRSITSMRQCTGNYHMEEQFYQTEFVNDVFRFATKFAQGFPTERVSLMQDRIDQLSWSLMTECALHDGYGSKTPLLFPYEAEAFSIPAAFFIDSDPFPAISRHIANRIKSGDDVSNWKDWIVIPEKDVLMPEEERPELKRIFGRHISRMISAFCEADRLEELLQWVLQAQSGKTIHLKHSEGVLEYTPATRYTLYLQEILRYPDIAPDLRKQVSSALEQQKELDIDNGYKIYTLDFVDPEDSESQFIEALLEKCGVLNEGHLIKWLAEIGHLQIPSEAALPVFRYMMQHVSQTPDRIRLLWEYVYGYDTENYYHIVCDKPVPDSLLGHILCTDNVIDLYLLCREYGDREKCHQLCRDAGKGLRRQHRDDAEHLDGYRIMEFSDLCAASGEEALADTAEEIIEEWVDAETQKALRALDEINPYTEYAAFQDEAGSFMAALFLNRRFDVLKNQVLTPVFQKLNGFIRTPETCKLLSELEKELQGVEHLVAYECEKALPESCICFDFIDGPTENIFGLVRDFYMHAEEDGIAACDMIYDDNAFIFHDEDDDDMCDEDDDTYEDDDDAYEDVFDVYDSDDDFFGALGKDEPDEGDDDFAKLLDESLRNASETRDPSLKESYCERVRDERISIILQDEA